MNLDEIKDTYRELDALFNENRYLAHKELEDWKEQLADYLPQTFLEKIGVYISAPKRKQLGVLRKIIKNIEQYRKEHNSFFIDSELKTHKEFFDSVVSNPLDNQQREAVVIDEDNNLVIAGAGSGKTTTIIAKIKYLTQIKGIAPQFILPISFTAKSAGEINKRLAGVQVSPQTFHRFGLFVIQSVEGIKPNVFDDFELDRLLPEFISELSKKDDFLDDLNDFILNYLNISKSIFDFATQGEYIQYMKDQNFTTYKKLKLKNRKHNKDTYRNEIVKSIEECTIANFLTLNQVEYEYEKQYKFDKNSKYKPDFTIKTRDGYVYLEHFGIDREGNVPPFFANTNESPEQASEKYQKQILWKRRIHKENNTKLIESYSYEFHENRILRNLRKNLTEAGVELKMMNSKEISELIKKSSKDQMDSFFSLCKTFLSHKKSNRYSIPSIREYNETRFEDGFVKIRNRKFIDLFEKIDFMYESHLKTTNNLDFNDMILKASEYIANGQYTFPIQYVIIDEFQDISDSRYRLLQSIREQNPNVKFFCVGDDWQSIFRFAGADVSLFSNFEKHFGYSSISRIETTYRFNEPLISLSSEFILKNPYQIPKKLKAPQTKQPTGYRFIDSKVSGDDDSLAIVESINEFLKQGLSPVNTVSIIGRYNFDIDRIRKGSNGLIVNKSKKIIRYTIPRGIYKGEEIKIKYLTAHKAKGLEADYIIVLNCNAGKYGFPSGKSDDPILSLVLRSSDQFEDGEERRLFYVAMTRAKKYVIFISNKYKKSKFVKEIQNDSSEYSNVCPKCKNGEIIAKKSSSGTFYGCTNWAYGCEYTTSKPPIVESREDVLKREILMRLRSLN